MPRASSPHGLAILHTVPAELGVVVWSQGGGLHPLTAGQAAARSTRAHPAGGERASRRHRPGRICRRESRRESHGQQGGQGGCRLRRSLWQGGRWCARHGAATSARRSRTTSRVRTVRHESPPRGAVGVRLRRHSQAAEEERPFVLPDDAAGGRGERPLSGRRRRAGRFGGAYDQRLYRPRHIRKRSGTRAPLRNHRRAAHCHHHHPARGGGRRVAARLRHELPRRLAPSGHAGGRLWNPRIIRRRIRFLNRRERRLETDPSAINCT
mmetsp:Transcript_41073/g.101351  ORF Transcript_41073/g.101351 Transcript_41073/m.101351 type:complete len:267 (-) Transcript_41073:36-836(-)